MIVALEKFAHLFIYLFVLIGIHSVLVDYSLVFFICVLKRPEIFVS